MNNMKMPANCAMLNEEEKMETIGGAIAESTVKAVAAVGGVIGLASVAATALSVIVSGNPFGWIESTMNAGKNFIEASMNAGQNFLNKLMGISTL